MSLLLLKRIKKVYFLLPPYNESEERKGVRRRRRGQQGWTKRSGKEGSKDEKGNKGRGNVSKTILHETLFLVCIWDFLRQNEKGNHQ